MFRARYRRVVFFWGRVVVNLIAWELFMPRVGLRAWSRRTRATRMRAIARRYRLLAIDMGRALWRLPRLTASVLGKMERGELLVQVPQSRPRWGAWRSRCGE